MTSFSPQTQTAIDFAADLFRQAKHAVLLTGAGFPLHQGYPISVPQEQVYGRAMNRWRWLRSARFAPRRNVFLNGFARWQVRYIMPSPTLRTLSLAELEKAGHIHSIITQNIDMLHQKAGSQTVIEMHGTMQTLTCTQCYHQVEAAASPGCIC